MEEQTRPFLLPVEVQLDGVDFFVVPGGNVEIQVLVINHQQFDDVFELTLRGVPLGWVTLSPPLVPVKAGQRTSARLSIQPPAVASASTGVYPIIIRAASQHDPAVSAESGATLRVGAYETGSRVGILMEAMQFSVNPGEAVTISFILINQGISEDNLRLAVDGIPISWVSTPTPMVRLQPGERREVSLIVQPPRNPQSRAGRTPFTIQAISQVGQEQVSSVDCILTVAAFSQFTTDLGPRRLEPDQPARLRIFNQGNIQDVYTVVWQNPNNELVFTTAQASQMRLQPGEAAALDFVVHPRSRRIFGGTSLIPFTVTTQNSEGEVQSHTGEAISIASLPIWVLPVALMLCLSLVCISGLVWNRGRTQVASATLTIMAETATIFSATQTASYNQTAAVLIGQQDTDGDGLTNTQEQQLGTNPEVADTDADRMNDGDEVARGLNPLLPDTDGDGLIDGVDLEPLDPANPLATASALAALPTPTLIDTLAPLPTATPEPTFTLAPTVTTAPVEATATQAVATATVAPLVMPANSMLVFESNREGPSEIYAFHASGSLTRLTINPSIDTQPAWSPDGGRVVFTSNRDGNNEIYVMNADGSAVTNLSNNPANDQYPTWSPDGGAIAFTSDRDGNQEIYIMAANGANPQNLTQNPAQDLYPAWYSEQGLLGSTNRIVFASGRDGNLEIYTMDEDGGNLKNMTNTASNESFPAAPRSGRLIAFVSDRDGNAEIYVMNSDGTGPVNRSNNPAIDTYPSFLPDGSWLAFTTNRDGNQEVYIMRADGSDLGNVTRSPGEDLLARWR